MIVRNDVIAVSPTSDIQAAMNIASANGGGIVELGPGIYPISAKLVVPSSVHLRGVGKGQAGGSLGTIIHNTDVTGAMDSILVSGNDIRVSDLQLTFEAAGSNGRGIVIGLAANVLRYIDVENVMIYGSPSHGLYIEGVETLGANSGLILSRFKNITITGNRANGGMVIESGATTLIFDGCEISGITGIGTQIYATDGVTFRDCIWDTISSLHFQVLGRAFSPCHSLALVECYFEQPDSSGFYFIVLDTNVVIGTTVENCFFNRSGGHVTYVRAISVGASASGAYYGTRIVNPTGYCLDPYNGTADITIAPTGNAYGTQVVGGFVEGQNGATHNYSKMSVTDAGTGTVMDRPTLGTNIGQRSIPQGSTTDLHNAYVAGTLKKGMIAYDTTTDQFCCVDNTGVRPFTASGVAL